MRVTLISFLLLAVAPNFIYSAVEFTGTVSFGGRIRFGLHDTTTGRSAWVSEGQPFEEFVVDAYDRTALELVLIQGSNRLRLKMLEGRQTDASDDDPLYHANALLRYEPNASDGLSATAGTQRCIKTMQTTDFMDYVASSFSKNELEKIKAAQSEVFYRGKISTAEFSKLIKITAVSSDIQISAQSVDPEIAALVANRVARKYIDYLLDQKWAVENNRLRQLSAGNSQEVMVGGGLDNVSVRIIERANPPKPHNR